MQKDAFHLCAFFDNFAVCIELAALRLPERLDLPELKTASWALSLPLFVVLYAFLYKFD